MRNTTKIWATFDSVGKPQARETRHGTVSHIILALAKWMFATQMGSRMTITFARTEEELIVQKDRNMAELESMLSEVFDTDYSDCQHEGERVNREGNTHCLDCGELLICASQ